jgi:response regulator RpfG family c-di-GMP phosphodiesterase
VSTWTWVIVGVGAWATLSVPMALFLGRFFARVSEADALGGTVSSYSPRAAPSRRLVLVDDEPAFRALLAATFAGDEFEIAEATDATEARDIVRLWRPDVVLLDVAMPGLDGISFCRELKARPESPLVVLITGMELAQGEAAAAGAAAVLAKPFSPLELVGVIDRLMGAPAAFDAVSATDGDQLQLYAHDLGRMLERERAQRRLLENAYRQTVTALATTLEARDTRTTLHSRRVTRYALALAGGHEQELLSDPSLVYGLLLHDIGKIGIPDRILLKDGPLEPMERRVMQRHPVLGEEILGDVELLHGEGLRVVRSHHERWDGAGYPDALSHDAIPLGARIFAVADALDAMTTERPYRRAGSWEPAVREVVDQSGRQFDPDIVETFVRVEPELRGIFDELRSVAA